jgi:hypothetical protein
MFIGGMVSIFEVECFVVYERGKSFLEEFFVFVGVSFLVWVFSSLFPPKVVFSQVGHRGVGLFFDLLVVYGA